MKVRAEGWGNRGKGGAKEAGKEGKQRRKIQNF
jgi:hypothetical protein